MWSQTRRHEQAAAHCRLHHTTCLDLVLDAEMFFSTAPSNIINVSRDDNATPDEDQAEQLSGCSELAYLKMRAATVVEDLAHDADSHQDHVQEHFSNMQESVLHVAAIHESKCELGAETAMSVPSPTHAAEIRHI